MSDPETKVFELIGYRPDGESFTSEILDGMPFEEVRRVAQDYCNQWKASADLFRVPYVNESITLFAASEMTLIESFSPKATP